MVCPKIQKKLNEMKKLSVMFTPQFSGGDEVQVYGAGVQFVVNVARRTCTSRRWDLNGIPCPHACAVFFENNETYVNEYYSIRTYIRLYSHVIHPI